MRSQKEVREEVLSRPGGRYREGQFQRAAENHPLVLKVREVRIESSSC